MTDQEIQDSLDCLIGTGTRRGRDVSDVVNGRITMYDPNVDRFKVNHTGGQWRTRHSVMEFLR